MGFGHLEQLCIDSDKEVKLPPCYIDIACKGLSATKIQEAGSIEVKEKRLVNICCFISIYRSNFINHFEYLDIT